jgi:hypothetical protein
MGRLQNLEIGVGPTAALLKRFRLEKPVGRASNARRSRIRDRMRELASAARQAIGGANYFSAVSGEGSGNVMRDAQMLGIGDAGTSKEKAKNANIFIIEVGGNIRGKHSKARSGRVRASGR